MAPKQLLIRKTKKADFFNILCSYYMGGLLMASLFLISPVSLNAQKAFIEGYIYSASDSLPIQNVQVFYKNQRIGAVTDAKGLFKIEKTNSDSLYFRMSGYADTVLFLSPNQKSFTIFLQPVIYLLQPVHVRAEKNQNKKLGKWNNFDLFPLAWPLYNSSRAATYFYLGDTGFFVKRLRFYITRMSHIDSMMLRIWFTRTENRKPGSRLEYGDVLVKLNVEKSWYEVDLSGKGIKIPGKDFFVILSLKDCPDKFIPLTDDYPFGYHTLSSPGKYQPLYWVGYGYNPMKKKNFFLFKYARSDKWSWGNIGSTDMGIELYR